ncbi:MAG: class I tRNA ligase family protein, partial [Patescibacteria group bacterium]
ADALRYCLITSPVMKADTLNFSEKGVEEVYKKLIMMVNNIVSFYRLYATDDVTPVVPTHVLDRWIVARLNQLVTTTTAAMNSYDVAAASRPIMAFVDDLSTWYVRRSRDRFKGDDAADKAAALATLRQVLLTMAQVMAPFTPFLAEHVYRQVKGEAKSVHLTTWPTTAAIDEEVLQVMAVARQIVEQGLAARAAAGIKIRQPLASYTTSVVKELPAEYATIITDELNVMELQFGTDGLDTVLTPELKTQGLIRELVRQVNALRKADGLTIQDTVTLHYHTAAADLQSAMTTYQADLAKDVRASAVVAAPAAGDGWTKATIDGNDIWLALVR